MRGREVLDGRLAEAGPMPSISCRMRKALVESRLFSARRRKDSRSFTCAASRNFRPPYFTKGMFRRISSTSRASEWCSVRKRTAWRLQRDAGLEVLQDAIDDVAGTAGLHR